MIGHHPLLRGSYIRSRLVILLVRCRAGYAHLPPPFPSTHSQDHHHEYLIRTSLRFDVLESALERTLSLVRKVGQGFQISS